MIIWGTIFGAIFGFVLNQHHSGSSIFLSMFIGALAGGTLRAAVRSEIELQRQKWASLPVVPEKSHPLVITAETVAEKSNDDSKPQNEAAQFSKPSQSINSRVSTEENWRSSARPVRVQRPIPDSAPDFITDGFNAARAWLFGGNTVVRMGVLVLFIGLAFLAKYSIDNALLPPEIRLIGIALVGIGLFYFGFLLRKKGAEKLAYALTLQGAGVAVLYLVIFSAFKLYQFLPANTAFLLLALICVFSTAIALMQNSMMMAFIGFAGAFAAPILVSTEQGNHVSLFSYYLLLNLGIVGIAWLRAWRPLNLLGFFATFGIATLWGGSNINLSN